MTDPGSLRVPEGALDALVEAWKEAGAPVANLSEHDANYVAGAQDAYRICSEQLAVRVAAVRADQQGPTEVEALRVEVAHLRGLLDSPDPSDFVAAAVTEARYQRSQRDDSWKTDADWFWLIGHLAGKVLHRGDEDGSDKRLHRITTIAAAAANWHADALAAAPSGADQPAAIWCETCWKVWLADADLDGVTCSCKQGDDGYEKWTPLYAQGADR